MPLGDWLYREAGCGNRWQYLVAILKSLVSSGQQRDNSGLMQGDLIWSLRSLRLGESGLLRAFLMPNAA
jgi:hypothetical protein